MTANLRLFRIEIRQGFGLVLLMPLAALVWWMATSPLPNMVTLWPQVSAAVRDTAQFLGPLAGGLAAWMAGRSHRSKTKELLATTAGPAAAREFTTWAATAVWMVLAYVVGASVVLVQSSLKATWGAPPVFPIFIALLFTVTSATLGYAAGTWVRSRFTAPLTAIALLAILAVPDLYPNSVRYWSVFSAGTARFGNVFTHVPMNIMWLQVWWLLGLLSLAFGAIALRHHRNRFSRGLFLASAIVSLAAAVLLIRVGDTLERVSIPYEPLCAEAGIEVCIHPAYEAMQPETLDVISRLTGPLEGVPGAPTKAEQVSVLARWELSPDGVLPFELSNVVRNGYRVLREQVATSLVYDQRGGAGGLDEAQQVVRAWLLQQAGVPLCRQIGGGTSCLVGSDLMLSVERFAALEPSVRDAWLHENYAALTRGELTLEDLP